MNQRLLVVGLSSVALATAAAAGAWLTIGRGEATAAPDSPRADTSRADSAGAVARADSARAPGADSARRPDSAGQRPIAAAESTDVKSPHPPTLIGTWYHGDGRSRYGDSLVLELREDGTARSRERRWTLDRTGWHSSQLEREGSWAVRYRGSDRMELCTTWTKPQKVDVCERVFPMTDTTRADRPLIEYAGRHWRLGTPPDSTPKESGAGRRRR